MWVWLSKQWGTTESVCVCVCVCVRLWHLTARVEVGRRESQQWGEQQGRVCGGQSFLLLWLASWQGGQLLLTEKLVKSWPSWRWEVWKWIWEIIQFVLIPSSSGTLTSLKTSCSLWRPRLPTDLPSGPQPAPRSCSSPSAPSRMNPPGAKKPAFQPCCCRSPSVQPRSLTCKSVVSAPLSFMVSSSFKTSLLWFFFFFFWLTVACRISGPQSGIEPMPPAVEVWSSNHWTTRECPTPVFLQAVS